MIEREIVSNIDIVVILITLTGVAMGIIGIIKNLNHDKEI